MVDICATRCQRRSQAKNWFLIWISDLVMKALDFQKFFYIFFDKLIFSMMYHEHIWHEFSNCDLGHVVNDTCCCLNVNVMASQKMLGQFTEKTEKGHSRKCDCEPETVRNYDWTFLFTNYQSHNAYPLDYNQLCQLCFAESFHFPLFPLLFPFDLGSFTYSLQSSLNCLPLASASALASAAD